MNKSGKYCCFIDPENDYSEKMLDSKCPKCGRTYGFVLEQSPEMIGDYKVIEPIGRGFYGATYRCERGRLNKKYVLKVASKEIYSFFEKDFDEECRIHMSVSQDTEHIVPIEDYFEETISFGDIKIPCYVAVLENIIGETLEDYLAKDQEVSARSMAQIAVDLFRIRKEFTNQQKYHNDLHANNILIQFLREDARRAEAMDETIRAVAIDLGSVSDASKSDLVEERYGDQAWLARHLQRMMNRLRENETNLDDLDDSDNRIAEAFERILYFLLPARNSGRVPSEEQLIQIVKDYFSRGRSTWKEPLKLVRFDDSFNAGLLDSWYVPSLLVDPDGLWIKRISASGPLIITGMRGCGKTMLLRGLDIHARAALKEGEQPEDVIYRIRGDKYIGLFASCNSLLTVPGVSPDPRTALERLFLTYCLMVIRAVRHLKEIGRVDVTPAYYELIIEAIQVNMDTSLKIDTCHSDYDLERFINKYKSVLVEHPHTLINPPAIAFSNLADAIRRCLPIWSGSKVFFLLDDVSTRYLNPEMIEQLISSLIFRDPGCAFKITTEVQTIEMVLRSPGQVEPARKGRDYDVFDLGAEVYEKTKVNSKERLFVERILEQRVPFYPNHPKTTPRNVLGECTLEEIARNIATSGSNSAQRKSAYHGIQAVSAICVGDIGDVIILYDLILKKGSGQFPIRSDWQSQSFLDFCSRRLYELTRRDDPLKDFALSFAEAANELLIRSYREKVTSPQRIRQYSSIYVSITTGDTTQQFNKIRELIDAGVFVLQGGAHRTKTRDSDPIKQFKLTYRKLFGLSSFIGLADRDRFELSGEQLEEWLEHPERGKEIFLRRLGGIEAEYDDQEFEVKIISETRNQESTVSTYAQESLFEVKKKELELLYVAPERRIEVEDLKAEELSLANIELAILGLGFEDRTLESTDRWLSLFTPKQAITIEYPERGNSREIKRLLKNHGVKTEVISYEDVLTNGLILPSVPTFVDITGLATPVLFWAIRNALRQTGNVWFCHTLAQMYYPLDEDLQVILEAERNSDYALLLKSLSKVLTGEKGPYKLERLINTDIDESLRKVLCAFVSAKHERLLSLLDYRDYDRVEIAVPPAGTPRNETARIAAEVAAWNYRLSRMNEVNSNDLKLVIDWLTEQFVTWYVDRGYNVEFGLTGSKIQAVACAAVSVECKLAQCWYVRPKDFDPMRFTKGTGISQYYNLKRVSREIFLSN